jgi:hypothetical protein
MTSTRTHKTSPVLSLSAAAGVLAAALLGALGTASTAHADGTDDAFIAALRTHGIEHESVQTEIMAGHLVCHQLSMGKTDVQVATDVMSSSTLDGENAGYFVAVAERAYCPQYND